MEGKSGSPPEKSAAGQAGCAAARRGRAARALLEQREAAVRAVGRCEAAGFAAQGCARGFQRHEPSAGGAGVERQLEALGAARVLVAEAQHPRPGRVVVPHRGVEAVADLGHAQRLEFMGREKLRELDRDLAAVERVGPARLAEIGALAERAHHGNLEQLEEFGGARQGGERLAVPGRLPLGVEADDALALSYELDDPVHRLDVGNSLGLGDRAHELDEEEAQQGRPEVPVARHPMDGVGDEGIGEEGVQVGGMVPDDDEGRLERVEKLEPLALRAISGTEPPAVGGAEQPGEEAEVRRAVASSAYHCFLSVA